MIRAKACFVFFGTNLFSPATLTRTKKKTNPRSTRQGAQRKGKKEGAPERKGKKEGAKERRKAQRDEKGKKEKEKESTKSKGRLLNKGRLFFGRSSSGYFYDLSKVVF